MGKTAPKVLALLTAGHVDTRIGIHGYGDTPYPGIRYGRKSFLHTLLVI